MSESNLPPRAFTDLIPSKTPAVPALGRAAARARDADETINAWLVAHSIMLLRVTVGAVFFVFGFLKFFPGVSPAQQLAEQTTHILTLGVIPGDVALVLIATLECTIGLCLLSGRGVRAATLLLSIELVGILSPVVLLPGTMFAGPHHAPTLAGQYVLKDVILVAAAMVIASTERGARLVRQGHTAAADRG